MSKTEFLFVRERSIKEQILVTVEGSSLEEAQAQADSSAAWSLVAEYKQPSQMTVMTRLPDHPTIEGAAIENAQAAAQEAAPAPAADPVAAAVAEAQAERAAEADLAAPAHTDETPF